MQTSTVASFVRPFIKETKKKEKGKEKKDRKKKVDRQQSIHHTSVRAATESIVSFRWCNTRVKTSQQAGLP